MRKLAIQATGNQRTEAAMAAPSGYQGGKGSPFGIGGAIAVHVLAIGVWLMIPQEMINEVFTPPPLITTNVPLADPPPPEQTEPTTTKRVPTRQTEQRPTAVDPIVPLSQGDSILTGGTGSGDSIDPGPATAIILPPADPPREPVMVEAAIDPRALPAFQPDYPGAMIRQGMEGSVTVRVTINAQGRVTNIARIAASDESFWLATERHALRKWRFRPATRDGVAVATTKVLTVRFTLTDR
ncbi:energy transducer TonB [Sphingobium sp. Ant17]|uniref:energy transducer TonB n=1 Tax=Sphingobium sp. Ant17 TaxID=1461752 RepID=UPI00044B0050|nr:energy transducer TonB [Sphingobium sp. Ant17]